LTEPSLQSSELHIIEVGQSLGVLSSKVTCFRGGPRFVTYFRTGLRFLIYFRGGPRGGGKNYKK